MKLTGKSNMELTLGVAQALYVRIKDRPLQTGDQIVFSVREDIDSPKLLNMIVTSFDEDGGALISLQPEDTAVLEEGSYVWGINLIRSGRAPIDLIRSGKLKARGAVASDE